MSLDFAAQYAALRTGAVLARNTRTHLLRLSGPDARSAALWLLPSRLHLRDAQARQSLLLDETGRPIADVIVAADDEDYLLLIDGPGDPIAHVKKNLRGDVQLTELDATHEVIDVHGPWAWELVSQVLGEDLLALPYLNFFRMDEGLCVRAGRTGEYGYHLLARREEADAIHARFVAKGAELELAEVNDDVLALAGFENWFFDAAHVPEGATPVELSLSWRLAGDRDFLGRAAIDARRAQPGPRQACLLASSEVSVGERVMLDDRDVGVITRAALSPSRRSWIASALIDPRLVAARITLATSRGVSVTTTAPPLVDNQSLYVDPRRHTFRTRDEVRFGVPREIQAPA
jgi:glycine cleavage system aminomethyltransferase T